MLDFKGTIWFFDYKFWNKFKYVKNPINSYDGKNSLLKLSQVRKNFFKFLYSLKQYKNLHWSLKAQIVDEG